ncbi:uncharacterized protein N7511_004335 [Penicillium nucicola]|uniref:uncharacterized protein n=1 Tax=Penicillium nucicola TaxID=1850975 RepID=UPI00254542DB|nr:uncharacterized protein N7511_004335 [Penicillium nucicola]KAJ5766719.1 hypothetical protein N7511_004335 [Penicillium nucicola]
MARRTPYSRPQAPSIGFRGSMGSTYVQPSRLSATVHRKSMPNSSQATFTAQNPPITQSSEETESPSDQSTAASTTQHRPGNCKKTKEKKKKRRRKLAQQRQVEHTQLQLENQDLREQLRQQGQSRRRDKESMQKFLHDCHAEAATIIKAVNILLPGCAAHPRSVPKPVRYEHQFAHGG